MKQNNKSEALYQKAIGLLPGGVSRNTVYHKPFPQYVAKASGCYVTDVDGSQRIDFANNMASLIHGHAHPAIVEAVTQQLKKGTAYTLATEVELSLAELLINRAESFEKIRFVNSGTEAVMAMIKASRAFTGKPKIAKAEGSYHGTYDFAEVSQTANPFNWGDVSSPNSVPVAFGTPQAVLDNVVVFPFNDTEHTLNILDTQADQIACVIIDPVPHRVGLLPATKAFVEALYAWTRRNNALLVFDEVVTFRVNYGGAQEKYTVKPDLTAQGKIIGGGFPIGALAGRSDVMDVLDPGQSRLLFPHSGTFSANPMTMTAGRVAMELFDQKAVDALNALTTKAIVQLENVIRIADVPVSITGAGSMFRLHFRLSPPQTYREAYQRPAVAAVINELLDYLFYKEHIIMINTCACMFSTAITQKEVDRLSDALLNGFRFIKPKLDELYEQNISFP